MKLLCCPCFVRKTKGDPPAAELAGALKGASAGKPLPARVSMHSAQHAAKLLELQQRQSNLEENLERDPEAAQAFRTYLVTLAGSKAGLDKPPLKPSGIEHFLVLHKDINRLRAELKA